MRLGVGKASIDIDTAILPLEGFTSLHDALHVRVFWIEGEMELLLISLEMTSLREYAINEIKELINQETRVDKEHIFITVTHSFSSPHTRSKEAISHMNKEELDRYITYYESLLKGVLEAVRKAKRKQEVSIGVQTGYCSINVNRDMYTKTGWVLGADDLGNSDKAVQVIRFDNQLGKPIALLYGYDMQSSIMDHARIKNGYEITSDLIGKCSASVEEYLDCVAMFALGGAGDQAPVFKACHSLLDKQGEIMIEDIGADGYILVNALGKKLAYTVLSCADKITSKPWKVLYHNAYEDSYAGQRIVANTSQTKEAVFLKDDDHKQSIDLLVFEDIAIVMVKPELSSSTAMMIKKNSPFHHTLVWTMVNGGAKYMPDQLAYDRITYAALHSMFAKGAAEELVEHAITYLKELKCI